MSDKTRFDRIKETVRLLKGLQSHGISDTNEGYLSIKEKMDEWITTGEAAEHEVILSTYRRKALIKLPRVDTKAAEIVLRAL